MAPTIAPWSFCWNEGKREDIPFPLEYATMETVP